MFLELLSFLSSLDSGFNVLSYLTVRAVFAMMTALLITLFLGKWIISKLLQYQIGQVIRVGAAYVNWAAGGEWRVAGGEWREASGGLSHLRPPPPQQEGGRHLAEREARQDARHLLAKLSCRPIVSGWRPLRRLGSIALAPLPGLARRPLAAALWRIRRRRDGVCARRADRESQG